MAESIIYESEEITVKGFNGCRWLIVNKTDETIVVVFTNVNVEPITIYPYDWIGFLPNENLKLSAFRNEDFYTIFEDTIFESEIQILYKVLRKLNIHDINLKVNHSNLIAKDSMGNKWKNEEFYKFLVDEAFVFNEDGSVVGISNDLLSEFKILAGQYGIKVKSK